MEIREVRNEDLDSLINLRLENAAFHASKVLNVKLKVDAKSFFVNQTKEMLEDESCMIFLSTVHDIIVGYIIGFKNKSHPIFEFSNQGLIDDIYVSGRYQRKDFGKLLLDKISAWFKQENVKYVTIHVYQDNLKGQSFWLKNGFQIQSNKMIKEIAQ